MKSRFFRTRGPLRPLLLAAVAWLAGAPPPSAAQSAAPPDGALSVESVLGKEQDFILRVEFALTISNREASDFVDAAVKINDPALSEELSVTVELGALASGEDGRGQGSIMVTAQSYSEWLQGLPVPATLTYRDSGGAAHARPAYLILLAPHAEEE